MKTHLQKDQVSTVPSAAVKLPSTHQDRYGNWKAHPGGGRCRSSGHRSLTIDHISFFQVVIYPILSLKNYRKDLHWYISQLEEAVILGLDDGFGLQGERKQGLRGVWIGDRKIAAVGIKVSRWVSMHGIAVNIKMEEHASGFDKITPCGIKEFGVVELAEYFPDVDVRQVCYPPSVRTVPHVFARLLISNLPSPLRRRKCSSIRLPRRSPSSTFNPRTSGTLEIYR